VCFVLILADKVFEGTNIQSTLRYVFGSEDKIPVITLQQESGDVNGLIDKAPSDIRAMFNNVESPIVMKQRYHEKNVFMKELVSSMNGKCLEMLKSPSSHFLAFLSHVKKDAGAATRLLQVLLHSRLKEMGRTEEIFLDCEFLTDLRKLPNQVKKSRVLVTILTEYYLTRPWCLLELHVALENNVPIVAVNLAKGGYDFEKSTEYLRTLSSQTLDSKNEGASATLKEFGIDVVELGKKLYSVLPKMKAVNFDPSEVPLVRNAQVEHILKLIDEKNKS